MVLAGQTGQLFGFSLEQYSYIFLCFLGAYLIGCLNFGYYVVRFCGKGDVRRSGSGNAGATNAGRVLGKKWFVLISVLDGLKGLIVTLVASFILWPGHGQSDKTYLVITVLFFCILGHIFPFQLGFQGGRGMATLIGGLVGLNCLLLAAFVATQVVVWAMTRRANFSAIIALGLMPFAALVLYGNTYSLVAIVVISILMIYKYRKYFFS